MNPTLFYNNNPSLKHPAWDTDSHYKLLAQKKIFKTKRSYERWVEKEDFLPHNLNLENYKDALGDRLNSLIQNYFIQEYERQRKLILFIQYFESKNHKFIFANDRRKGRLWVKVKSNKIEDIYEGIKYFSKLRKKNIILLPSQDLLSKFQEFQIPVTKNKYQIEFPNYIFQATEIDPTKTIFTKSFSLRQNSYLSDLEAESIHIIREVVSETKNPVMLYSVGKDSSVMLHLAQKAFYPSPPPFPLMHVDTRWKFKEMYLFRNWMAKKSNMKLITHINPEGVKSNINPFDHGSSVHTDIMKTQGLKQALDQYQFDAAFGGARRDEEKSRAKERIFSFRTATHQWDPKNQRPELWNLYNAKVNKSESIRVFPLSNWTELDIWQYIYQEQIPIVPLYFAKTRPVIQREGMIMMVDDDRLNLQPHEKIELKKIRFRTLGCYPLTGAIESEADSLESIVLELLQSKTSERQGRAIDADASNSMEKKKLEGYF
ncbi:MAG: sulfate adenylyltransferase subunit CysD [Proteobacteria bacterium]|jgi:sulfate adenylyltransferase subunit 2|nr:sulfate adenylyltransferase subunit CysD [Pseudomonadota bacterium]